MGAAGWPAACCMCASAKVRVLATWLLPPIKTVLACTGGLDPEGLGFADECQLLVFGDRLAEAGCDCTVIATCVRQWEGLF